MDKHEKLTRRRLLQLAAQTAAMATVATLLPLNLRRALAAAPPTNASLKDIKHVVLLMMENRSFDHYFGTLAGVRGFADPTTQIQSNGRPVFFQPDKINPDGFLLPFHLNTSTTNAQIMPSTSHAWDVQHGAWNNGQMDNWLPAHRAVDKDNAPYVMGYFKREDIPFHFALAESFTICDAYHSSVMGPTHPNRLYWMTGMIDPDSTGGGPIVQNYEDGDPLWDWTTYPERLEEAGVSWKVYQEKDNFGTNVLENFKNYKHAPKCSPLYQKAVAYGPAGTFEEDAMNDRLPAVSWILPTEVASEHPAGMPAAGAAFIASKIDAIAANPDVWAKTAFILCYDENDGLFDHVAPPVPPPGTPSEFVKNKPIGGGFRVPCIVISPWTAGGWVCSEPFDHTSILQFLETFTGVKEPNITQWRRDTFGDLTSIFRFGEPLGAVPLLPDTQELLMKAEVAAAKLPAPVLNSASQTYPQQEFGWRRRVRV